jgi:hypothetical protein
MSKSGIKRIGLALKKLRMKKPERSAAARGYGVTGKRQVGNTTYERLVRNDS